MFLTYVIACESPFATYTKKDIAFSQLHQENAKDDTVIATVLKLTLEQVPAQLPHIPKKPLPFINFIKKILNTM